MATTRNQTKTAAMTAGGSEAAGKAQARGFEYMNSFGAAWMECVGEMHAEVARFVTDRIREDVRTQQAVMSCKDPASFQQIRQEFLEQAVADYSNGPGKLMEIGGRMLEKMKVPVAAA